VAVFQRDSKNKAVMPGVENRARANLAREHARDYYEYQTVAKTDAIGTPPRPGTLCVRGSASPAGMPRFSAKFP
jgi:hypothetical protein